MNKTNSGVRPFALVVWLFALTVGTVLFAEEAPPEIGAGVLDGLKGAEDVVTNAPGWIAVLLAGVLDFVMRAWKTAKPMSLLIFSAKFLDAASSLLKAVSRYLDGVLQRTKDGGTPPPKA